MLNVQDTQWSLGFFEHTDPRGYLLSMKQQLQQSGVAVEAQVRATLDSPGQAIASHADALGADLIAIATSGDFGLSRLMRGSVADYLLRNTKLPILLQNVPEVLNRPATAGIW
jgi:nucleotide-binding universal stress UspA family protein